jgi:hypothetical protein
MGEPIPTKVFLTSKSAMNLIKAKVLKSRERTIRSPDLKAYDKLLN